MLEHFKRYVNEQHLFPHEQRVLLAVSGGRDSVCMAHLMKEAGYRFAIAHGNFHLRPGDCDRDQRFVRQLAESFQVPFHTIGFDTRGYAQSHNMSIEEAARELRYRWFADLCKEQDYPCLATAHHRDDAIETFFLNLFRGTGIAGLHGIQPLSSIYGMTVVRPMLCFSRADIDSYVDEHGLAYVEDSTNAELNARRNSIRHRLMPLLRELYPSVDTTMAANIERLCDTETVYRAHIEELRSRIVVPYQSRVPGLPMPMVSIDLAALPEPTGTVLFELLRPYGFNSAVVAEMLTPPHRSGRLFYSPTHVAEIHRMHLLVAPQADPVPPYKEPMQSIRLWRKGDRFRPKGMRGSRLVSDFLKDLGLSRIERQHVWLLVDGDDRILSVIGLREAER